ncbi:alanine--glyoxylate aminotransferase family protein [Peptoniphilus sp. MSJ-1]|uniref:Alanine--glyoxylate aminotransferase family protein n=1 Tax=Peptoniphilus ovalis TaxID=2841503 RepID=A0ABS6FGA4_9FIRM|nr:alanine--glyoxylate aminotransferase family protein [Peptoniphilus ovalis]MBU5668981.1 alanine--glyoxylate aminotransferase family protein [Peptoniphilus ovalis]
MKLFLPGPVSVRKEVLEKFLEPVIGHRSAQASEIQKTISINIQKILGTEHTIITSTSSGTGLMEGAIRSCTKKRALICSLGSFGELWYKLGLENSIETDILRSVSGEATDINKLKELLNKNDFDFVGITHNETSTGIKNDLDEFKDIIAQHSDIIWALDAVSSAGGTPINQDYYGIDIVITSSQKCLGLTPGLSFASISDKAYEKAKTVENRGHYFDFVNLYDFIKDHDFQYPSTPAISNMVSAAYQLDYIVNEEGVENRYKRHLEMSDYFKQWANKYFPVYGNPKYQSPTITAINNTNNIDFNDLNNKLMERDIMISNGYGDLINKTFRVGHMGDYTIEDMKYLTKNIEEVLGL